MTLRDAILKTTPQMVYDCLSTMSSDLIVDPADGTCCPLAEFFADEYPDEGREFSDDEHDTWQDLQVSLSEVRFGNQFCALPDWMIEYQEAMIEQYGTRNMGQAVALLEEMFFTE